MYFHPLAALNQFDLESAGVGSYISTRYIGILHDKLSGRRVSCRVMDGGARRSIAGGVQVHPPAGCNAIGRPRRRDALRAVVAPLTRFQGYKTICAHARRDIVPVVEVKREIDRHIYGRIFPGSRIGEGQFDPRTTNIGEIKSRASRLVTIGNEIIQVSSFSQGIVPPIQQDRCVFKDHPIPHNVAGTLNALEALTGRFTSQQDINPRRFLHNASIAKIKRERDFAPITANVRNVNIPVPVPTRLHTGRKKGVVDKVIPRYVPNQHVVPVVLQETTVLQRQTTRTG